MYVKIFNSILDSSLAENRRLRHFFIDLLLCCDGDGNVLMTNQAICRRTGATLEEVVWGLEELQNPDEYSLSKEHDGRRIVPLEGHGYGWKIVNYERYRDIKSDEQRRRDTAERVRRHREKKAGLIAGAVTERGGNGDCVGEFDRFWKAYPRKSGKIEAQRAFVEVLAKDRLEDILEAVEEQKGWEQWKKDGGKFIPSPANWLRDGRWEDEAPAESIPSGWNSPT